MAAIKLTQCSLFLSLSLRGVCMERGANMDLQHSSTLRVGGSHGQPVGSDCSDPLPYSTWQVVVGRQRFLYTDDFVQLVNARTRAARVMRVWSQGRRQMP
eukprot:667586-Rhodomonas_salina.1